ncbi:putative bifunctional diguanylate cyclase/phosphodiesterase [uncultured Methylobacterium sp.]|uniref:putative bifunctional diguanylate cyclase/phosphodiesterase n=1 Tax=uncultured Methylobacterium sp. TaxID=157278 RepID=UPI0035CB5CD3
MGRPLIDEAATARASRPHPASAPDLTPYLNAVQPGLLLVDGAGRVILCTRQARCLLGLPDLRSVETWPVRRILHAVRSHLQRSGRATLARLHHAVRQGSPVSLELSVRERFVEVGLYPVIGGGWAATIADVSARKVAEADAAEMARLDPLTGLPNRLHLRERLDQALERLRRGEACAVLLIDLDRFKPINDTLGHPIGDALLKIVADRLRSTLRPVDTVARIGGDEFVIVQAGVSSPANPQALARRIIDLVGRSYIVEGHLISIGCSVGIALAPTDAADAGTLLKNADLALYRAKIDGRGTFRSFEPSMNARMRARRALELDMRQALARREFELHYQPQLNLETNQLVGCEALIRWRHPVRGMVSPLDFIPLAEEIGLIVSIGEWVLRQACRDAATWPSTVSVAVNLSPAQFKSERLVEMIVSALATAGLDARRLELEITEGVLLQESETTLQTLHRLRDLGIRVSMDDFGTGYSSLSYLRSFPFDKIKIDRSFVSDLSGRPDGNAIIRAIAGLGRSLGMTTVAEGVETADQMQCIRAEGCTDMQGYFLSKPIPASDILALLTAARNAA